MLKYLFLSFALIIFSNAKSQKYFEDYVDSTIKQNGFSESDWAIGIGTQQSGTLPIIDSLGNLIRNPEDDWTVFISKIKDTLYLQKFSYEYISYETFTFKTSKRIKLPENFKVNFTADSLYKTENEYMYPYIYKDNKAEVYDYQAPSPHACFYTMYFITKKLNTITHFDETCIVEKLSFLNSTEKSLNFDHNSTTFIFRSFTKLKELLKENKKLLLLK